jgi:hypothetical protein
MKYLFFLLVLITAFSLQNLSAQNRKYFTISGKVLSENGTTENTVIEICPNGGTPQKKQLDPNGRFRFELNYNSEYLLLFTQPGCSDKRIVVNTAVPDEILTSSPNFPNYLMAVQLVKSSGNPEPDYLTPINYVSYQRDKNCFNKSNVPPVSASQLASESNIQKSFKQKESSPQVSRYEIF